MRCTPHARRWKKASCPAAAWRWWRAHGADRLKGENDDQDGGIRIVLRAVEEPLRQIVANAGEEPSVVLDRILAANGAFGYNAATGQYGDLVEMGVMDPTKVTRIALQNAASVAGLILTTDCMIAEIPEPRPRPALPGEMEM
jgi:chaperonin GroEL